jgi:uncharacterized protein YdaU (DUF1376 family)
MHYYQFNIGDYVSHTRHLSPVEDIAYRRLLDAYYLQERPLSSSPTAVARQIGMREYESEVVLVLEEFFELGQDGWTNSRADKEIEHYHSKIQQASRAGKASAERRMNGRSTVASTDVRTDVQPTNNQEPITKNQQTNSVSKDTGVKTPMSPDEIIFGYGVPLLTNAGVADKQARSFLGGLRKTHGDDALVNTLRECIRAKPLQPLEWLAAALPPAGIKPKLNKQEALEASNRAVVDRLLKKEGLA